MKKAIILARGNQKTSHALYDSCKQSGHKVCAIFYEKVKPQLPSIEQIIYIKNNFGSINELYTYKSHLSSDECDFLRFNLEAFIGHLEREVSPRKAYILRNPFSLFLHLASFSKAFLSTHSPDLILFQNIPFRTLQYVFTLVAINQKRNVLGFSNVHYPVKGYAYVRGQIIKKQLAFIPLQIPEECSHKIELQVNQNHDFLTLVPQYYKRNKPTGTLNYLYNFASSNKWLKNRRRYISILLAKAYDLIYIVGLEKINRIVLGIFYNINCLRTSDVPDSGYWVILLNRVPERSTYPDAFENADVIRFVHNVLTLIPPTACLLIKEHPSQFSIVHQHANSQSRSLAIYQYLFKLPKVQFCPTTFDQSSLLKKADKIVVATGTAGLQALQIGKSSIIFGNPTYRHFLSESDISTALNVESLDQSANTVHKHLVSEINTQTISNLISH